VVRRVMVHAPPSVSALEFLLPARMPRLYGAEAARETSWLWKALNEQKPAPTATSDELLDEEICRVAHVMARLCASEGEIAEALGFSLESFNELRDRHVELAQALKSGKEFIDAALERALVSRASVYDYTEEEIICSREGDIVRTQVSKFLPADLKALDLWLRAHPGS
jgi:hypothetical protein